MCAQEEGHWRRAAEEQGEEDEGRPAPALANLTASSLSRSSVWVIVALNRSVWRLAGSALRMRARSAEKL